MRGLLGLAQALLIATAFRASFAGERLLFRSLYLDLVVSPLRALTTQVLALQTLSQATVFERGLWAKGMLACAQARGPLSVLGEDSGNPVVAPRRIGRLVRHQVTAREQGGGNGSARREL
ncbi:MAG: hypothetical protein AAF662_07160 [Pseudomonadota bacterium]